MLLFTRPVHLLLMNLDWTQNGCQFKGNEAFFAFEILVQNVVKELEARAVRNFGLTYQLYLMSIATQTAVGVTQIFWSILSPCILYNQSTFSDSYSLCRSNTFQPSVIVLSKPPNKTKVNWRKCNGNKPNNYKKLIMKIYKYEKYFHYHLLKYKPCVI